MEENTVDEGVQEVVTEAMDFLRDGEQELLQALRDEQLARTKAIYWMDFRFIADMVFMITAVAVLYIKPGLLGFSVAAVIAATCIWTTRQARITDEALYDAIKRSRDTYMSLANAHLYALREMADITGYAVPEEEV